MILTFVRGLLISFLCFPDCVLVIQYAMVVNFSVRGVICLIRGTVPREIIKAGRRIFIEGDHGVLIRRVFAIRGEARLGRVRYANLVAIIVRHRNGFSLCQATRLLLAVAGRPTRSTYRQGCVILRSINGHSRFTPSKVRAIPGRLVMEVMDENGVARQAIFFNFLRVWLRGVRTVIGQRIVANVLRIRNVGTNLHLFRNGVRFANL